MQNEATAFSEGANCSQEHALNSLGLQSISHKDEAFNISSSFSNYCKGSHSVLFFVCGLPVVHAHTNWIFGGMDRYVDTTDHQGTSSSG